MRILHIGEGKICCENLGYGKWVGQDAPEVEYQSIISGGNFSLGGNILILLLSFIMNYDKCVLTFGFSIFTKSNNKNDKKIALDYFRLLLLL